MSIAVITTFPNHAFEIYAKQMLQSFAQYWPPEIPLLVALDDTLLADQVAKMLRPQDAVACGWDADHKAFVERNKDKESQTDYRKQPVRFCHKVFAIKRALDAILAAKAAKEPCARYLIWMDADVVTNKTVTMDDIKACLPKEGDAVSYLGRKDWPHSECGWLAFDLECDGDTIINTMHFNYCRDDILKREQWHDSWEFDYILKTHNEKATNLTLDKPGMDIWPHSPMGKWSTHFKGPAAKAKLAQPQPKPPVNPSGMQGNIVIQTQNAIPHEEIRDNIRTNQLLIKNWIRPCDKTDEEIVVVSAGPSLVAEDVREEAAAGRRIIAVKHALKPLEAAGVKPWACILLDPREHVADFVESPDKGVLWLVASQVKPEVTKRLLDAGCEVWGYHAAVGADEDVLTDKQNYSVVIGGSATATRGMYLLEHLGFWKFRLYGYDLCYMDKPEKLGEKDKFGQEKYLNISVGYKHPFYTAKREFWTEAQLVAQFEEINHMITSNRFEIRAFGYGVVPFFVKANQTGKMREKEHNAKIKPVKLSNYKTLFQCKKKKTPFLTRLPRLLPTSLLKPTRNSNSSRA